MTWAIVINPTSGQGKGAEVGRAAVGYFGKHDLKYQIITGISAENKIQIVIKFYKIV